MPIEYTIDVARGFIHAQGWGYIGDKRYRAYIANFLADPAVRPGMKQLADWRAVTHGDVTTETVRETTETVRAFVERQRRQPKFANYQIAIVGAQTLSMDWRGCIRFSRKSTTPILRCFGILTKHARGWASRRMRNSPRPQRSPLTIEGSAHKCWVKFEAWL
jgi:hypothetical protein